MRAVSWFRPARAIIAPPTALISRRCSIDAAAVQLQSLGSCASFARAGPQLARPTPLPSRAATRPP
jgi:hypothetical protein